ncbi:dolichyl-phosphate beta-glucosyltransferase [Borealophlyctis nickersoniae]|nr:dolichyl-phosphate beta-glucosyltransferase [Borealophlyctis nickersoniae]
MDARRPQSPNSIFNLNMGYYADHSPLAGQVALAGVTCLLVLVTTLWYLSPQPRPPTNNELHFTDAITEERRRFPSIQAKKDQVSPIALTVVIPAYNETARLPGMLKETVEHLEERIRKEDTFAYEIIIVDDGSKDGTSGLALECAKRHMQKFTMEERLRREIRVLSLEKNRGKGGAVNQGMLHSRGERILFADADGATKFSDLDVLEERLAAMAESGLCVAVGSRAHMVRSEAVVKRSFVRNFLMYGFHTVLYVLGIGSIKDTQCGFKLLTRGAGQLICPNMHCEGWIFDIELLLIAYRLRIPVVEVPVSWHEVEGTKMSLIRDSILMLRDLLLIRLNYLLGIWTVKLSRDTKI